MRKHCVKDVYLVISGDLPHILPISRSLIFSSWIPVEEPGTNHYAPKNLLRSLETPSPPPKNPSVCSLLPERMLCCVHVWKKTALPETVAASTNTRLSRVVPFVTSQFPELYSAQTFQKKKRRSGAIKRSKKMDFSRL